jgi:hypothetical protein
VRIKVEKKKDGHDATRSIIVACHAAVFKVDTLAANGAHSLGYPGQEVALAMVFTTPLLWCSKRSYDGVQSGGAGSLEPRSPSFSQGGRTCMSSSILHCRTVSREQYNNKRRKRTPPPHSVFFNSVDTTLRKITLLD